MDRNGIENKKREKQEGQNTCLCIPKMSCKIVGLLPQLECDDFTHLEKSWSRTMGEARRGERARSMISLWMPQSHICNPNPI